MASGRGFMFYLVLFLSLSKPPSLSASRTAKHGCYFNAIYSFGDSMADTGNLLREGTGASFKAISKFPYGMTAFDKPTGRCSDGYIMLDYFASGLGLPLVPPYLDKDADFEHGVNFAVAGATALDKSFFSNEGIVLPFTNSSLDVQLSWFDAHMQSTCKTPSNCAEQFERALFFVGEIGGNDYNYALFGGKPIEELKTDYVPKVVDKIIDAAKRVIDVGAVHLIVPGNYPIGCMPSYLTAFHSDDSAAYDKNMCLKDHNSFAAYHNEHLQEALQKLRDEYPHLTIMYADYYNGFLNLLHQTGPFGFDGNSLLKACCGVGDEYNFDATRMCGAPGTTACRCPSRIISWDGIHLTQEAYKRLTGELTFGGHTHPHNELWKKWMCAKNN